MILKKINMMQVEPYFSATTDDLSTFQASLVFNNL